ncbi:hypothetical protein K435DRAFT_912845 [Dendrothele bispora CBS 962.96]|uniref:Uncharacterized protein n=1 Tax=Dendrothele bispora (strain CBS 962.96) TaxID=1314807 RepID=A0A4S8LLB3_DENBC|nr:hypothetical protein K435DRAFT_912845 [Dendrothele bispora CBS 962.96]
MSPRCFTKLVTSGKTSNLPLWYTSHTAQFRRVRKEGSWKKILGRRNVVWCQNSRDYQMALQWAMSLSLHLQPMSSVTTVNGGGNSTVIPIQVAPNGLPSGMTITMSATPSVPDSATPPYY